MDHLRIPRAFVPTANADAVQKLRHFLRTENAAVELPVMTDSDARERDCYVNVRKRVERDGGRMRLGWAVWQHAHLFIEGEPHAVYDPEDGKKWVDCTPHTLPDGEQCQKILFIVDETATYDFDTLVVRDNVRVPLVDDSRVSRALTLFSESTALMNSVPGVDIALPPEVGRQVMVLRSRAMMLLSDALPTAPARTKHKIWPE